MECGSNRQRLDKLWGVCEMKKIHYCGGGFKGQVVKARGVAFCGFCGKEFRK